MLSVFHFQHILSEPEEIVAMNGQKLAMRLQVISCDFKVYQMSFWRRIKQVLY